MNRESLKSLLMLVFTVSLLTTMVTWILMLPEESIPEIRLGAPIISVAAMIGFLFTHFQRNEVPDYLRARAKKIFERGGLCFAFELRVINGTCMLDTFFQNKYDRSCNVKIALRQRSFFFERRRHPVIAFNFRCEEAAYGVVSIPVPSPTDRNNRQMEFEIGATVKYSEGQGRMLRFRNGEAIRANADFRNPFRTASIIALFGGSFIFYRGASVSIKFPKHVSKTVPDEHQKTIETYWKLGDPLLEFECTLHKKP